jgi:hypothetical protein
VDRVEVWVLKSELGDIVPLPKPIDMKPWTKSIIALH